VFLPSAIFSVLGNVMSGRLRNHFGPRAPAVAGQLSMVVGLAAMALTAPLGSPWLTAVLLVLIGPGGSVAMPVITSVVLDSVTSDRAGTASAVFNTFRQVGGAVAIAVFGTILASSDHFVTALRISFSLAGALLLATAAISLRLRSDR
jgi:DHA2 family methylenomycin A resistance protein-like MFS transporter